jgi:hypothetical protein
LYDELALVKEFGQTGIVDHAKMSLGSKNSGEFREMAVARSQRQDDVDPREAERFELRRQRLGMVDDMMGAEPLAPRPGFRP